MKFNFLPIRIYQIDHETWYAVADVASVLGLDSVRTTIKRSVPCQNIRIVLLDKYNTQHKQHNRCKFGLINSEAIRILCKKCRYETLANQFYNWILSGCY